jgi:hypothetical protein
MLRAVRSVLSDEKELSIAVVGMALMFNDACAPNPAAKKTENAPISRFFSKLLGEAAAGSARSLKTAQF